MALLVILFRTVFRTALFTFCHTLKVISPRTMWYRTPGRSGTRPPRTSTTACSLEVVTFATDVRPNFLTISQTNTSNFTKRGVRFFRGFGGDFDTHTTFEWSVLVVVTRFECVVDAAERRTFRLFAGSLAGLRTNWLIVGMYSSCYVQIFEHEKCAFGTISDSATPNSCHSPEQISCCTHSIQPKFHEEETHS